MILPNGGKCFVEIKKTWFVDEESGEERLRFCVVDDSEVIECFDTRQEAEAKLEELRNPRPRF